MAYLFLRRAHLEGIQADGIDWTARFSDFEVQFQGLVDRWDGKELDGAHLMRELGALLGKLAPTADTIRVMKLERPNGHTIALPITRYMNYGNDARVIEVMARRGAVVLDHKDRFREHTYGQQQIDFDEAFTAARDAGRSNPLAWARLAALSARYRDIPDVRSYDRNSEIVTHDQAQFEANYPPATLAQLRAHYGENFSKGGAQIIPLVDGDGRPWAYIELTSPFTGFPACLPAGVAQALQSLINEKLAPRQSRLLAPLPSFDIPDWRAMRRTRQFPIDVIDPSPALKYQKDGYTAFIASVHQIPPHLFHVLYNTAVIVHSTYFDGFDPSFDFQFDPQSKYIFVLDRFGKPLSCSRVVHRKVGVEGCLRLSHEMGATVDRVTGEVHQGGRRLETSHPGDITTFFSIHDDPRVLLIHREALHLHIVSTGIDQLNFLVYPEFPGAKRVAGREYVLPTVYQDFTVFDLYRARKLPGSFAVQPKGVHWETWGYRIPNRSDLNPLANFVAVGGDDDWVYLDVAA